MTASKVLLIIIGSNTKLEGGLKGYEESLSVTERLSKTMAHRLAQGRKRMWKLIQDQTVTRDGVPLGSLPRNLGLRFGTDVGGRSKEGLYLPAAERFHGRFFTALGPEGPTLLTSAWPHILILNSLYGLLLPSEPIQDHSLHVTDHPRIARAWTDEDLLTEALLSYVEELGITQVLDLTAQNDYRFLIAWSAVRADVKSVLHCFGEQSVGPGFLGAEGELMRMLLCDYEERDLLALRAGQSIATSVERVYLQALPRARASSPREIEYVPGLNTADRLERMRRCTHGILGVLSDHTGWGQEGWRETVGARIRRLDKAKHIPREMADHMYYINHRRCQVVYDRRPVSQSELEDALNYYTDIREWARGQRWFKSKMLPRECYEIS